MSSRPHACDAPIYKKIQAAGAERAVSSNLSAHWMRKALLLPALLLPFPLILARVPPGPVHMCSRIALQSLAAQRRQNAKRARRNSRGQAPALLTGETQSKIMNGLLSFLLSIAEIEGKKKKSSGCGWIWSKGNFPNFWILHPLTACNTKSEAPYATCPAGARLLRDEEPQEP